MPHLLNAAQNAGIRTRTTFSSALAHLALPTANITGRRDILSRRYALAHCYRPTKSCGKISYSEPRHYRLPGDICGQQTAGGTRDLSAHGQNLPEHQADVG